MNEESWKRELRELLLSLFGGSDLQDHMKAWPDSIDFEWDEESMPHAVSWSPPLEPTLRGRRWFLTDERAVLAPGTEGFLIELLEMGVVTPHVMERFLERLGGEARASVGIDEAREILISLIRAAGRERSIGAARELGPDMTVH